MRTDFKNAVHTAWVARSTKENNRWANIQGKMDRCKKTIQIWVRKNVHAVDGLIKTKTKEFEVLQGGSDGYNREKEKSSKVSFMGYWNMGYWNKKN